nr:hypothetical protein [Tanacetum cinerariifolium]
MTSITSLCDMACQVVQKKLEEKQIEEERAAKAKYWKLPICYDDDDDEERFDSLDDNIISRLPPFSTITPDEPVLSTEEPGNSLSMGDEHLDTISATESDKFIKSGVENLIPIPSESEGIPEHVCDVPSHDNSPPLDISKDQIEDFSNSNKEFSSIDDDSFSIDDIDYAEASPLVPELVSSEVMEIVIPEVGGIDDDILLMIKHDVLREKLLNVNLLIAKIKALNANPTPSSDCKTNSGSTTTHPDISLPKYEAFHDDHVKEFSSGSPTTHSDSSLYASFMFDLSINPFPSADRSDSYELTDELIPFISAPEYDCFLFKVEPNSKDFTKDVVEDMSPMKEPQVLNALPTHPTLQLNMKFQPSSEYLFTYVVWIFLPFLVYSVVPHYLLSLRNEDIIFDPGICNSHFPKPDISHRCGTVKKFNTHRSHLNKCPMLIQGQNNPPLDVLLIEIRKKEKLLQEKQWAYLSTHPSKRLTYFCFDDDDDEDYTSAITPDEPVLSTEEPDHSLSMGDEHVDTILATESDEFIKFGVETLILIPSEFEGIPEHVCDVPSHDNSPPLDVSKDQIEDFSESNKEFSSIDDDSFSIDDIDYVEASPPDSKLVSSEVMEIFIPEVGGINDDILLTIQDDVLREKLRNVNLLISKIEALNANPTPSSDCKTKSSSTSLTSLLEETNTFDNSLPEFETFCFDVEEISSGSTTAHPDISLSK